MAAPPAWASLAGQLGEKVDGAEAERRQKWTASATDRAPG